MWTIYGMAAPQRVEFVRDSRLYSAIVQYRGGQISLPKDTLFELESEAWLSLCDKAAADMECLHRKLDHLHREHKKACKQEKSIT